MIGPSKTLRPIGVIAMLIGVFAGWGIVAAAVMVLR